MDKICVEKRKISGEPGGQTDIDKTDVSPFAQFEPR